MIETYPLQNPLTLMAEVKSTYEMKRGAPAPDFQLPDGNGKRYSLEQIFHGKRALIVVFVCNHCPFVVHLADQLGEFAREMEASGVGMVAISSNDVEKYPQDGQKEMVKFAAEHGWEFPYLYDETQDVAKAYGAACTPDFFVFDQNQKLAWAGQFDDSRPGNDKPITGGDIRSAVEAALSMEHIDLPQKPSSGCNIKWKPGNEPAWFG